MSRISCFRLLLLCSFWFLSSNLCAQDTSRVTGNLKVHFINVGQADAILIECPTNEHFMLIDAGDTRYPGSSKKFKAAMKDLFSSSQKELDVVVASHPHADHIGSMKWVLENFRVLKYLDNGQSNETAMYQNLIELVYAKVDSGKLEYKPAEVAEEDFIDFCPAKNVDASLVRTHDNFEDCDNPNDCSVVVRVDYDNSSFLFVGDSEIEEEQKLLADNKVKRRLNTDVLKAGHHGSNTSSSLAFVKAVSPKFVIVSVGEKNVGTNVGYKHPQANSIKSFNSVLKSKKYRPDSIQAYDKDLKKWVKTRVKEGIYFTIMDGNVVLTSDGNSIRKE